VAAVVPVGDGVIAREIFDEVTPEVLGGADAVGEHHQWPFGSMKMNAQRRAISCFDDETATHSAGLALELVEAVLYLRQ
jgi:hypothetical protein